MKFEKLQEKVENFCTENNIKCGIKNRALDLTSEIGEVSKEILKSSNYGKKKIKTTEEIKDEMGDVFFSLIALANEMNINLENALKSALNKYKKRIKNGNIGSKR